jgi:hypothetical protein
MFQTKRARFDAGRLGKIAEFENIERCANGGPAQWAARRSDCAETQSRSYGKVFQTKLARFDERRPTQVAEFDYLERRANGSLAQLAQHNGVRLAQTVVLFWRSPLCSFGADHCASRSALRLVSTIPII